LKIYKDTNVLEESLNRIRWLFDEFEEVIVNFSGGKDSTVLFHLALKVAKEKNRLPLKVAWIDQEAEWQSTSDYVQSIMERDDVEPFWYQMPLRISNTTSTEEQWLYCWEENKKWMRDKWPKAITKNIYGTLTFKELFDAIQLKHSKGKKSVRLAGVRTEESPARYIGVTHLPTYKYATWGRKNHKKEQHFTMYPIYDWSYTDIWKFIHDEKVEYNKVYDWQYQYGTTIQKMRVSNVHHETAVTALYNLQELEPDTWEKLTQRIQGVSTAGTLKDDGFKIKVLPYMFKSWKEYRDYLLDNLITDEKHKKKYKRKFAAMDKKYLNYFTKDMVITMHKAHINTILHNDYHFTKLGNFQVGGKMISIDKERRKNGEVRDYKY